jgi:hypothetical protein
MHDAGMLRNAVLHISNEQPLLADLFELPTPSDVAIRLTNLRSLDGKRPIFVDDMKSVFLIPYHRISFVEIPPQAMAGTELASELPVPVAAGVAAQLPATVDADEDELAIDEDFLRRIREV